MFGWVVIRSSVQDARNNVNPSDLARWLVPLYGHPVTVSDTVRMGERTMADNATTERIPDYLSKWCTDELRHLDSYTVALRHDLARMVANVDVMNPDRTVAGFLDALDNFRALLDEVVEWVDDLRRDLFD